MAEEKCCFICGTDLCVGEVVTVKEKGLKSLRSYSLQRKDNKIEQLRELNTVVVHTACRKLYTRADSVKADLRRKDREEQNTPSTSSATSSRSHVPRFKFAEKCLFCAEDIPSDYQKKESKKELHKRVPVYNVRSITLKESILIAADKRSDSWGEEVKERICNTIDLVAADAQYHQPCFVSFFKPNKGGQNVNEPSEEVRLAMEEICSVLKHSDECQFTINELTSSITGHVPHEKTIKRKLTEIYGDEILISAKQRRTSTICFRNTGYKILSDAWYNSKETDPEKERMRIVKAAADIIREDIRSRVYQTTSYPPSNSYLENLSTDIPDTLDVFLKGVITKGRQGDVHKAEKKCVSIAHAIITATRPRSFTSPLLTGLSLFLYRRFGSKNLITMFSNLGFCTPYAEAQLLEISAIMQPRPALQPGLFCQFVFDNADCNVNTIDGSNTFHSMGGITCITPKSTITGDEPISKLQNIPSAAEIGKFGMIPLKPYEKIGGAGLRTITIKNLEDYSPSEDEDILFSTNDVLWMCGKFAKTDNLPGWRGFMEIITRDKKPEQTRITCLPFINSPPSAYDTIFTTLHLAVEESKKTGQKTTFITFDQPLYAKARDVLAACKEDETFSNVYIRLGGFHLLMSFLGAIGFIMAGSGLHELLSVIYAPISVNKMFTGHAYSRAVRGHLLAQVAISKIVFEEIEFSEEERTAVQSVLCNLKLDPPTLDYISKYPALEGLPKKLKTQLQNLERNGATAKLWVQYFTMVNLMKNFIEAERSGDWKGHLRAIQQMLPYFHASGHFPYAKSGQMYLQDMLDLETKIDAEDFDKFANQGYFTIKRTNKFWSGTWSDMTIEQSLMRSFSVNSGLTRGRGYTDSVQCRWILGMPATFNICEAIEEFCEISFVSSEQHVDCRDSRITKDEKDVSELHKWLLLHPPFPILEQLYSISSGVTGGSDVNSHRALEVGKIGMENMIGCNFKEVKMQRKNTVRSLATVNSAIKIYDKVTPIDPLLLFHRISVKKQTDEELELYLQYELAPFPFSLFNESGTLKTKKSALYDIFEEHEPEEHIDYTNVIDGGFLLHRVLWQPNQTVSTICENYITYVQKYYGPRSIVVFDGYSNNATSTKMDEQRRRLAKNSCTDIHFQENTTITVPQEKFLGNFNNKQRLISMLSDKFHNEGYVTKQALDDADLLIIQTAIEMSFSSHKVAVIGEDVDLLILLIALASVEHDIHFIKPGKRNVEQKMFSSRELQSRTGLKDIILFLHAFGGCDTTSCFYKKGKLKCFRVIKNKPHLKDIVAVYNNSEASHEEIAVAGQRFILALYDAPTTQMSLNKHRYNVFAKSCVRRKVDLASLPPSEAAARQHCFRVYHQVQKWYGNLKSPEDWGWRRNNQILEPVPTTQAAAPDCLLHMISCNCKKGCTSSCGCRKAGLKCSVICGNCQGITCQNSECCLVEPDKEINEDICENLSTFDQPDDPYTLFLDDQS